MMARFSKNREAVFLVETIDTIARDVAKEKNVLPRQPDGTFGKAKAASDSSKFGLGWKQFSEILIVRLENSPPDGDLKLKIGSLDGAS